MSDGQVEQINSALQKTELLAAIGREIDRVDRAASLRGYTAWAIRGAIALLVWQLLTIAEGVNWIEAFRIFYVLIFSSLAVLIFFSWVCGGQEQRSGRRYYFLLASSPARRASATALLILTVLLAFGSCSILGFESPAHLVPVSFFGAIAFSMIFFVFLPWVPVAKDSEDKSESVLQRWSLRFVVTLLLASSIHSFWRSDWVVVDLIAGVELKVSVILLVLVWLVLSDVDGLESLERNHNLRRLELDLSLGKSSVHEVRERFDVLMLGMTAQEVVRPWVQAVVNELDDARSRVQEGEALLDTVRRELAHEPLTAGGLAAVELLISRCTAYQKSARQAVGQAAQGKKRLERRLTVLKGFANIDHNEISSELSLIQQSATETGAALDALGQKMGSVSDDLQKIKEKFG